MSAAWPMALALPTEVPPNLTTRRFIRGGQGSGAREQEVQGAKCKLQSEMCTVESERFAHRSYTGKAREPERGEIREGRSSRNLVGHELADDGCELEAVTRAG